MNFSKFQTMFIISCIFCFIHAIFLNNFGHINFCKINWKDAFVISISCTRGTIVISLKKLHKRYFSKQNLHFGYFVNYPLLVRDGMVSSG